MRVWWKSESELAEVDIPECYGDEGATNCSICVLAYRVYETMYKLKYASEHRESYNLFRYWVRQIGKRYNKEAQLFMSTRIEKAIIRDQHEIVSSDINDILNGTFDREVH